MKNKILKVLILTGVLSCGIMLGGCVGSNSVNADNASYTFLGKATDKLSCTVYEFKDNETGVHYFSAYEGGLIPRYNADGTLYCD